MTGAINQMQMRYVPQQDRVLFRVNSTEKQEFRLWLTRRYLLMLINVLGKHFAADPDISTQPTPDARKAVQSFKQEQAASSANFSTPFAEEPAKMPLGDEIPLAYQLDYRIEGENLHLGIKPEKGQGINLVINRQINASLMQLIGAAAQQADWKIGVKASAPTQGHIVN